MRSPSSSCSRASSTAYPQNLHQYFLAIRLNSHVAIVRLSLLRYQLSRMSDQNIPPLPSLGRDSRTPQTTGLGPPAVQARSASIPNLHPRANHFGSLTLNGGALTTADALSSAPIATA